MFCSQCGKEAATEAKFCSACGNILNAAGTPAAAQQTDPTTPPKPQPKQAKPSKIKSGAKRFTQSLSNTAAKAKAKLKAVPKKKLMLIGVGGLSVIAVITALIVVPQMVASNIAAENKRLAQEDLTEAFSEKKLKKYLVDCAELETTINSGADFARAQAISDIKAGTTDARAAQAAVNANAITSTSYASEYTFAVTDQLQPSFEKLMSKEERAKTAGTKQTDRWNDQWIDFSLNACNVSTTFEDNEAKLASADLASSDLVALAATAPWYPEGWYVSPTDQTVVWKWDDPSDVDCYNCSTWQIVVLTQSGCSSVYAEISITQGGTAVDWTNESLGAIGAGQQGLMTFKNYPYRAGSMGQLSELNCN